MLHYIESKLCYIFSTKSTSASDGVMGLTVSNLSWQCLKWKSTDSDGRAWNMSFREVKWEHLNEIWTPVNLNEFP